MSEEAKILFYQINSCGYYKYGRQESEFGDVASVLSDLGNWISNLTLVQRGTYEVRDGEELEKSYCLNCVQRGTQYLVSMWNQIPTTQSNAVAAISADSTLTNPSFSFNEFPENTIPGYATYFWIIPEQNLLATVRFHHSKNGHKNFAKYINEFMAKFSSYAVTEETDDGEQNLIMGYREADTDEIQSLYSKFHDSIYKKDGKIEYISQNSNRITKIIRKNRLSITETDDRNFLQRMMDRVLLQDVTHAETDVKVKYEVSYTPSPEQLDQMISEWNENNETRWDDIGFNIAGNTYWLSHSSAKDEVDLDITRDNDEVINAQSLIRSLQQNQDRIFRSLD
ncbi:hypothetical protein [Kistimonas asteriae]|uniref:hypothetical protein n=1 Tax=Kistimonas asteriae TaxID=517724 RepID=UPI001BA63532|nr:hypothetical protein [Kistimonas asteriae]